MEVVVLLITYIWKYAVDNIYSKIYVISKAKDVNIKIFNMVTRINDAKTMVKHNDVIVNANLIVKYVIQIIK